MCIMYMYVSCIYMYVLYMSIMYYVCIMYMYYVLYICFIYVIYMYYALCFVLVEHSVGSNTNNA